MTDIDKLIAEWNDPQGARTMDGAEELIEQLQEQVEQKDSAISNYALEVNKIHAKNEATNKRLQEQNRELAVMLNQSEKESNH